MDFYFIQAGGDIAPASLSSAENIKGREGGEFGF